MDNVIHLSNNSALQYSVETRRSMTIIHHETKDKTTKRRIGVWHGAANRWNWFANKRSCQYKQALLASSVRPFFISILVNSVKLSTKKVDSNCNCRLFIWNKLPATACRVNINQITFMDVSSRNIWWNGVPHQWHQGWSLQWHKKRNIHENWSLCLQKE